MENIEKLKDIVEGCLHNNRRSQEALFQMFYGKMLSVCMRYISDRDTAQEVLQEGFIKVFDKLEVFDFKGSFEGWVRRIVVNTAIDSIRKAKRAPILKDNDNDFKMDASNEIEENEKIELIEFKAEKAIEAIHKLSPGYRTVFNLFVIEEYSHKEIAEILGISEGTSKSNLSKAKKNLKNILTEEFSNIRD
ncbi:MAG: RNA polymerase sigma factor [Crocinitomicaceae bacterium]